VTSVDRNRSGFNRRPKSQWTWPGNTESSLANHLSRWPHFTNPAGMSYEQKIAIHDRHHNQIGPVSARQIRRNNSW